MSEERRMRKEWTAPPDRWMYLIAVLLAIGLKFHYSMAESHGLMWILAPTAWLVSHFTHLEFSFSEAEGYVNTTGSIVIAPACAGVNFLIICFCMLVFAHLHRFRHQVAKMAWLPASGLVAMLFTLLVNTIRIVLSINSDVPPGSTGLLTPETIHRLEGISVYFLALSLLYYGSEALFTWVHGSRSREADNSTPSRLRFLIPFFWYLAVTLGIPLARGSFGGNLHRFVEHSQTVVMLPVLFLITFFMLKCLVNRLIHASPIQIAGTCTLLLSTIMVFSAWDPGPGTTTSFNTDNNGLWVESKWYTGFDGSTGESVLAGEVESLTALLARNHIRFVYVRAGQIAASGEVEHMPGPVFFELKKRSPEVVFLPWISGNADELPLQDPNWRNRAIQSMGKLNSSGIKGVHLDFEPINNNHPGYVELLKEIRDRFDGAFFVSHATCRVAPFGFIGTLMSGHFWSQDFYRATMQVTDQTVLMGYNTALCSRKMYCSCMKRQTRMLLEWASEVPNHQILIGIPSYDRVSLLFDPVVENVVSASLGIRAALEEMPKIPKSFKGVAIYANWTTSPEEWKEFQSNWMMSPFAPDLSSSMIAQKH